jgi:nucleoid-associated protein YgaU
MWDTRLETHQLTALRKWPTGYGAFNTYEWVEGNRLDQVANNFYGTPNLWHKIMDYNPEISDPLNIKPGTVLRIPHE